MPVYRSFFMWSLVQYLTWCHFSVGLSYIKVSNVTLIIQRLAFMAFTNNCQAGKNGKEEYMDHRSKLSDTSSYVISKSLLRPFHTPSIRNCTTVLDNGDIIASVDLKWMSSVSTDVYNGLITVSLHQMSNYSFVIHNSFIHFGLNMYSQISQN